MITKRLELFPDTSQIEETPTGRFLTIGGCDLSALADRYGTPLYLYDRSTLDGTVKAYRDALAKYYPGPSGITYAGKAFLCVALARWTQEHDLWIDCTGVGELKVAAAAGVPKDNILVHGVNKSPDDLAAAISQAGTIVVDNLTELERLVQLFEQKYTFFPSLWLRFRPGVAVDTHTHTQTGQDESKFGMDGDEVLRAVHLCRKHHLPLNGLHFHQGSHFHDPAPLGIALEKVIDLMIAARAETEWTICPGGGWGLAYHEDDLPQPEIETYVASVAASLVAACRRRGLSVPPLQLEPGRSLVARAGVALYRVGTVKQTGQRRWLLIDGGMADNPRFALYGTRYSALPVRELDRAPIGPAYLAGPYCESGDLLIENLPLPQVQEGELLTTPAAGAYQLSMASNYNGACRPAVLWLEDGQAHLIQDRETPEDLLRRDRGLYRVKEQESTPTATRPARKLSPGVRFAKYQALGNDYVVLNPADMTGRLMPYQIRQICDRHYGLGSDGILLGPLQDAASDFGLLLFNPDGSEFENSGNGLRIFSRYLWDEGLVQESPFTIGTLGGAVIAQVHRDGGQVTIEMGVVSFDSKKIPVGGPAREVIKEEISIDGQILRFCAATIGNPHCVVLRDAISPHDAQRWGPIIETDARFPQGTNVQFMRVLDRSNIQIEIWERGVGYTLASGSSSCAAAATAYRLGLCDSRITVHMPGGEIAIAIAEDFAVTMTGPVARICAGEFAAEFVR